MKKLSNAQLIYRQGKTTSQLKSELRRGLKVAQSRMQKLKSAKLTQSEFYQEHKKDFVDVNLDTNNRLNISKELAKVNQFLNSKSSTPKGLLEAEQDFIDIINTRFKKKILNSKNVRRFQRFMRMYKDKYQDQTNIPSHKVVDAFVESERLQISQADILANLEEFAENEEKLKKLKVENLFNNGVIDGRRRFTLEDYINYKPKE